MILWTFLDNKTHTHTHTRVYIYIYGKYRAGWLSDNSLTKSFDLYVDAGITGLGRMRRDNASNEQTQVCLGSRSVFVFESGMVWRGVCGQGIGTLSSRM